MRFAKRTNWDLELNSLAKAVAEHRAAGKPLIDLTVSNPTECGFTYDTEAILGALRNAEAMKYEPNPKGLEVARRAVAGYYADRGGGRDEVSIDDIFMTTGTSEGYSWLMRLLCDVGDEVLVPSPGYPLLDFLADLNDVKLVRYPLIYTRSGSATLPAQAGTNPETDDHGWHFDLHALEQAITPRTRAVVVVHPNNPTGNYVKPHEQQQLNEICAARGLAVIADEVFLDFARDGMPRSSFVTNGREAGEPLTFTLSGLSKICGLPQMKVAWIAVSGAEAEKRAAAERLEVIADTYLSPNAPLQLALPTLLATRRSFREQVLQRMAAIEMILDTGVARKLRSTRLRMEGGWNTVLACATSDAPSGIELLDKKGILVHPGDFYAVGCLRGIVVSLLTPEAQWRQAFGRG
jgi:aspartate/methionine/tyrosine aminotransferase